MHIAINFPASDDLSQTSGTGVVSEASDFQQNLRLLCGFFPSVAEVCRRLGINRAQFNKYLSGRSRPSPYILKRLCDFFGVEEFEILSPHADFAAILASSTPREAMAAPVLLEHARSLIAETGDRLDKYCGRYHEYYFSMSAPGRIMKSFVHFARQGDEYVYERIERLIPATSGASATHCRYLGTALQLQDRIFLQDYESLTRNEICATIFFPCYQEKVRHLSGLRMGVAALNQRSPACTRVAWARIAPGISTHRALADCGLLPAETPDLDPQILALIDNGLPGEHPYFTTG